MHEAVNKLTSPAERDRLDAVLAAVASKGIPGVSSEDLFLFRRVVETLVYDEDAERAAQDELEYEEEQAAMRAWMDEQDEE